MTGLRIRLQAVAGTSGERVRHRGVTTRRLAGELAPFRRSLAAAAALVMVSAAAQAAGPWLISRVIDDSTSAVDADTELAIQEALDRLMRERRHTVFVIAQRVSTVRDADLILVLDDGRIAAQGTHEELRRDSALYSEILGSQLAGSPLADSPAEAAGEPVSLPAAD